MKERLPPREQEALFAMEEYTMEEIAELKMQLDQALIALQFSLMKLVYMLKQ